MRSVYGVSLFVILFVLVIPQSLMAQVSLQNHPRITGIFWSLPSKGHVAVPGQEPFGGSGWRGGNGLYDPEWGWDEEEVKFLRRFDQLDVDWGHVIAFSRTYPGPPRITAFSLNHYYLGDDSNAPYYNHDAGGHSASKQDLLAKSKGD